MAERIRTGTFFGMQTKIIAKKHIEIRPDFFGIGSQKPIKAKVNFRSLRKFFYNKKMELGPEF